MDTVWTVELEATLREEAWVALMLGVSMHRAWVLMQQMNEMQPEHVG